MESATLELADAATIAHSLVRSAGAEVTDYWLRAGQRRSRSALLEGSRGQLKGLNNHGAANTFASYLGHRPAMIAGASFRSVGPHSKLALSGNGVGMVGAADPRPHGQKCG